MAAASLSDHDRSRVEIRRVTKADRDALGLLFASLSGGDRQTRFFSPFEPDEEFLDHLVAADDRGACQLVAVLPRPDGGRDVLGEAGAWPLANGNAELGITVRADCRGWLGKQLFAALMDAAAEQPFPMLEAEVLMTNRPMIGLLRPRGYAAIGHDGYRTARLVLSTQHRMPEWTDGGVGPRILVEAPAARWDGEEVLRSAGMQVMVCPGPDGGAQAPCPALVGRPCPLAAQADAIVVHLGEALDHLLANAHTCTHPGVPVVVHPAGANLFEVTDRAGRVATKHARRPVTIVSNDSGGRRATASS